MNCFSGTPLYALKLAFARVADQRQIGLRIHLNTVYRTGFYTGTAAVTAFFIQLDPVFPGQGIMRTGRDTFVVWTRQTYFYGWYFRPFGVHENPGALGGIFSKMGPRADEHANLAFSAKCTI
jgi:hypothetical protein